MMHGSGVLTDADLASAHAECEANPDAYPVFSRICDLSEVTAVSISDEWLEAWATSPVANPPVQHALVCSAPLILKRVLDYIALSRKQFREVLVFPTYDQALAWLKLES